MAGFEFSDTSDLATNIESFLEFVKDEDPDMAVILRAHFATLYDANDDLKRRAARGKFNALVKASLDALVNNAKTTETK